MFRYKSAILVVALMLSLSACAKGDGSNIPTVSSPTFGTNTEITFPHANPPEGVIVKILDDGGNKGAKVEKNDLVLLDYLGKVWGGDTMPDSTLGKKDIPPRTMNMGDPPIQGWSSLVGTKVGQRVLLLIPPSQGYGELGSESIGVKKNDSLAYVVDIKATVSSADADKLKYNVDNPTLPTGISITSEDGSLVLDTSLAGSEPAQKQTFVYAKGEGPAVKPGQYVIAKTVKVDWGKKSQASAWKSGVLQDFPADEMGLSDLPLGSVALVTYPATMSSSPQAMILQIISVYDAS